MARYLVSASSLPEMTLRRGGSCGPINVSTLIVLGMFSGAVLVHSCREAGEEDDECCQEKEDHSRQDGPHAERVICVRSTAIIVDFVLDDAESDKVTGHHYDSDDEGDCRDERCQQCAEDSSAERKKECNKSKSAGDWVEDHDASKSF